MNAGLLPIEKPLEDCSADESPAVGLILGFATTSAILVGLNMLGPLVFAQLNGRQVANIASMLLER